MKDYNNISSRYDAVAKQAVNFGINAQRWYTVFDLKCQIALALGADLQEVKDCLSVYDVDYLIYKTYGGELSKLDLMSDYDVLVETAGVLDSGIDRSLLDSEYIAETTLVELMVPVQSNAYFYVEALSDNTHFAINSVDGAPVLNLEYSSDGKTWQNWDYKSNPITANAKEKVYLRGRNEEWTTIVGTNEASPKYNSIVSADNAEFNIGGRLSSLFTANDEETDKSITMSAIFKNSKCRDASKLIVPKNAKLSYAFSGCGSLISAPRKLSDSITHGYQYSNMFLNCTSLTEGPALPATSLAPYCYSSMFGGCKSLTEAPQLPATTLAQNCYYSMFESCTSLVNAPELPATTLAQNCYYSMFESCTSLLEAPQLPATTLDAYCYCSMFYGCTSLTKAPESLPATEMKWYCCQEMFAECTSLLEAPQLPATTLDAYCYGNMFQGCTSLTGAPQLPATTLAASCYSRMFAECTSLLEAPQLPATTLAQNSYYSMFESCASLLEAPQLPATTLASGCYARLFSGCTSLTNAPVLRANTLAQNSCYAMFSGCSSLTTFDFGDQMVFADLANSLQVMFNNCSKLSYIRCLYDVRDGAGPREYTNWVAGVAPQGTFVTNTEKWKTGPNGIPSGWQVVIEGDSVSA